MVFKTHNGILGSDQNHACDGAVHPHPIPVLCLERKIKEGEEGDGYKRKGEGVEGNFGADLLCGFSIT